MWELASLRRAGVVALVSAALLLFAALLFGALRASAQTECAAARAGPAEAAAPEPAACRAVAQADGPAPSAPRFPAAGAAEPVDYLQRGRSLAVQALAGFASALAVVGMAYWVGRRARL